LPKRTRLFPSKSFLRDDMKGPHGKRETKQHQIFLRRVVIPEEEAMWKRCFGSREKKGRWGFRCGKTNGPATVAHFNPISAFRRRKQGIKKRI